MKIQMNGDNACRHGTITLEPYHARGTSIEITIDDGSVHAVNITILRKDLQLLCDAAKVAFPVDPVS